MHKTVRSGPSESRKASQPLVSSMSPHVVEQDHDYQDERQWCNVALLSYRRGAVLEEATDVKKNSIDRHAASLLGDDSPEHFEKYYLASA